MLNEDGNKFNRGRRLIIPALLVLLIASVVAAVIIGTVNIPVGDVFRILLKNWGLLPDAVFGKSEESIIYLVRFPRVITAALVGAALAASGAVMQGMFRNPMADPGILGVSSGAGFGAVISIITGLSSISMYFMPLFASAGAIAAVTAIYLLSVRRGRIPVLTLILSGIAVSTFLGAVTSAILTHINDYQLKYFVFWTMGSLNGRMWEHVGMIVLPLVICIFLLFTFSRDLNIMLLGEEEAQSVGLDPSKTRKLLLVLTSITTAVAVSVSGPISFVGLIVPHILRLICGPDHRTLLPASALGGAFFLVCCDIISRLPSSGEINIGVVTSLLGAPYFLYLLLKNRKEGVSF
jgi:iron complex transport system permease protein